MLKMIFSGRENNISSAGGKKWVFQGEIWNKHFSSKMNVLIEKIPILFLSLKKKKEKQNDSSSGNVTLSPILLFHSK